jgi:hypothetical protein
MTMEKLETIHKRAEEIRQDFLRLTAKVSGLMIAIETIQEQRFLSQNEPLAQKDKGL